MQSLDIYLKTTGVTLTDLAQRAGVSKARLSQLRQSQDWPPALALKIETITDRGLDAGILSPVIKQARETVEQA